MKRRLLKLVAMAVVIGVVLYLFSGAPHAKYLAGIALGFVCLIFVWRLFKKL